MKIYRYMSVKEFEELVTKEYIKNLKKSHNECKTGSKGFCFIGEDTTFTSGGIQYHYTPNQCIEFLNGIVTNELLIEFESNVELTKSIGTYRDPIADNLSLPIPSMEIVEYSVSEYGLDHFKPLRYGFVNEKDCSVKWMLFTDYDTDIKLIKHHIEDTHNLFDDIFNLILRGSFDEAIRLYKEES